MKRLIAMLLAAVLCFGLLAGCESQKKTPDPKPQNQEPAPEKDDGVLKILMIGHSLGNDSVYMLPQVFKNEGYAQPVIVGNIYHSGCRLNQHVDYLSKDAKQYAYFEYDNTKDVTWQRADCNGVFTEYVPGSGNDIYIEDGSIAQTMLYGIQRHDWDMVMTQAGVFEAANIKDAATYAPNLAEDFQTLRQYVLDNDIDKDTTPKFGWNMTWTCPSDDMLNDSYYNNLHNNFDTSLDMYEAITATVKDVVAPGYDFDFIMPSGTAIQNAESSYLEAKDLYRDTIHANDLGRLIVAYTWYCTITDTDINDCKFGAIGWEDCLDSLLRLMKQDWVMTDAQKQLLIESVSNALATPYAVTQSQYTTAPTA